MPSNPDTFYLTAEVYKAQTTVSPLVTLLTEEEVTDVLLEAMTLIDAYIGDGWMPYDDEQEFIFPRSLDEDANEDPYIPRPISLATRMIADAILEEREKGVLPHQVAGEGSEGHSYTKHSRMVEPDSGFEVIPPSALALLQKFKRTGGQWAVDDGMMGL